MVPSFASVGKKRSFIDVQLSYRLIKLLSEGLYASPHKAIEELVANSFDAGARRVIVLQSDNLHSPNATIAVIDDGVGMDEEGLNTHWLIGLSGKRNLAASPLDRQQIGKFGIGKLATYVLAQRLTHITKKNGRYISASMDYADVDRTKGKDDKLTKPIKLDLRVLTEDEAKGATGHWTGTKAFAASKMKLFGKGAPESWTVGIMSELKEKVHTIQPPMLRWVLRTALPLRDDFEIWLNGEKLAPSKAEKGKIKTWILGKDIIELPRPAPKDITVNTDSKAAKDSPTRYGLVQPTLGRITGYAEAYKDLITGKSDQIGRSYGFFVYVRERLINVEDGHFGISPNELRHGTFGKMRVVVHMDGLDEHLNSNRETLQAGPAVEIARDILRAIFNSVRKTITDYEEGEEPGAMLARKLAETPSSVSRRPLIDLAREVYADRAESKYLRLPEFGTKQEEEDFLTLFAKRASEEADSFLRERVLDLKGKSEDVIAVFDLEKGQLIINALHPFVATFYEQYTKKSTGYALDLLAMAEVLQEAQMFDAGIRRDEIEEVLLKRDQLLRILADSSGHEGANAVATKLLAARNSPDDLEVQLCSAFRSLGFDVSRIGKKGEPDGIATAVLSADDNSRARRYRVCLEAKSKEADEGKVSARTVAVSALKRHRKAYACDHNLVVGRAFPSKENSALATEIAEDRAETAAAGALKTITLITVDDLARLVRLRPIKQLGLLKMRDMFLTCSMPEQTAEWIDKVEATRVKKPPYSKIIQMIHDLAEKFQKQAVEYGSLRTALSLASPSIKYETNQELADLCTGMMQMAPGAISANHRTVELDQSPQNVIDAIDQATQDEA